MLRGRFKTWRKGELTFAGRFLEEFINGLQYVIGDNHAIHLCDHCIDEKSDIISISNDHAE